MKVLSALLALALSAPAAAATQPPRLIVAIAIDQFSTDLFSEYRAHFTGGLKRLQQGAVFANGFQSHAATETCPGHATILTGGRPYRTGIIANNWVDYSAPRADKGIYCAEDESVKGSTQEKYTQSVVHLKIPTLGDRMKAATKATRVVAVAGKDRAAIMMGGKSTDQLWFWNAGKFDTLVGRRKNASADKINGEIAATIAAGLPAPALPDLCRGRVAPVPVSADKSIGNPLAALAPATPKGMRVRPELDRATIDLASALTDELKLGQGKATDLLAISLSVTDYIGHAYGTEGPEMCTQMVALDEALDVLFKHLDGIGVPYMVVLTADHGGHDATERNQIRGFADDRRFTAENGLKALNTALGHGDKPAFRTEDKGSDTIVGDLYLDAAITGEERAALLARAKEWLGQQSSFAAIFTRDELLATPPSQFPPEAWTLAERAAASVDRQRSGDLVVLLKPRLSPIRNPGGGAVATHGSPWDYDRRVPILFWSQGMAGFEQPNSIETVDIMPTLAALIGLPVPANEIDGKCRDLDVGANSTCPAN